ncbi:DUF1102 domain-containing protein [Halorubrum coriense]|uniref:DUF1102 domain-containing protein n=1 Tax=Halorubrum coriense TaxID=64713 RepID=UPI001377977D|nr:DUF1102 domain-containing protein [Halorubrum coriense]
MRGDRRISVSVASETEAYLALTRGRGLNGGFSEQSAPIAGNQIGLDFNGANISASGEGVGQNSTYEFNDVFRVKNQGTQQVFIQIDNVDIDGNGPEADAYAEFYVLDTGHNRDRIDGTEAQLSLSPGSQAQVGVRILTADTQEQYFNKSTTVHAKVGDFGATETISDP